MISDSRKEQKRLNLRRSEAQYLRFLRTLETAQNFSTVKIIGKGAFGEVKLVQRKTDGKIYALKSLVKTEMVKVISQEIYSITKITFQSRDVDCSNYRRINLLMLGLSVTS